MRDPRLENTESVSHSEEDYQKLLDQIEELRTKLDNPMMGLPRTPGLRVSPKGAVSVYGIHANFPVTLYPEQWERIFEHKDMVTEFIKANKDALNFKDDTQETMAEKQSKRESAGIVPRPNPRAQRIETAANTKKAA